MTEIAEAKPWDRYLDNSDRAVISRARFGHRMGFGDRPAIVAIDCQRYMVGERGVKDERYPSSCGEVGWAAVDRISAILHAARAARIPMFLTRFALDRSGADIGVYGRKRTLLQRPDWCLEGTEGAELLPEVGPGDGDIVFTKKKPSAFFGTPLLSYLIDRAVDTVIVVGGATSNCVRATVFDLPPTISARSCRPTRSSTACRSRTRSASSTWIDSSPTSPPAPPSSSGSSVPTP